MIKKNILFTFDYELFLGKKSGSVKNCMLIPTQEVVKVLNSYKVKGVFFVDCSYLYRLESTAIEHPKAKLDYLAIKAQLEELIAQGHYIYPHIHPHWIDAKYLPKTNQWDLSNNTKYRFSTLTSEDQKEHFKNALAALTNITQLNTNSFNAYRAGGWCIQPFSNFAPIFQQYNITADFSVLGGAQKKGNTLSFDFSSIPHNSSPYLFQSEIVTPKKQGTYKEFPISSIPINKNAISNRITNKILWKLPYSRNIGDGISSPFISEIPPTNFDLNYEMVSIELLSIYKLNKYNKFLKENDYMQFISHPKMISKHNLDMLKRFLKQANNKYRLQSDWKKISF